MPVIAVSFIWEYSKPSHPFFAGRGLTAEARRHLPPGSLPCSFVSYTLERCGEQSEAIEILSGPAKGTILVPKSPGWAFPAMQEHQAASETT